MAWMPFFGASSEPEDPSVAVLLAALPEEPAVGVLAITAFPARTWSATSSTASSSARTTKT